MPDSLFRRPYFWTRLRANPLGKLIEEFVQHLSDLGYSWATIRERVQSLEHFGCWLRSEGLKPQAVNQALVKRFIETHLPNCRCSKPAPVFLHQIRPALKQFLKLLRLKGVLKDESHREPIEVVLDQFHTYQREVCGLAESTCRQRSGFVREFLHKKFGSRKPQWSTLRVSDVTSFISEYGQRYRPASLQVVASSLRRFLAYLQSQGQIDSALVAAVPRVTNWRLANVPKALTEQQTREFLSVFDRSTANGSRDYAMALCQVVLGLRVSEVANLSLDDIDWQNGIVRIIDSKGHCSRELPLPSRVGQAIVAYIRDQLPGGRCRNVFVRHKGAKGAPVSNALIKGVMQLAYAKTSSCEGLWGTHVLRHTAATRLLQHGAKMKEIADVLGHRSIETTTIYAKVDIPQLKAMALPWPESQS